MKVIGFTFIRNALKYDYPIREAILSILPLCDKVVVAVGQSEDETLTLIRSIAPKKIQIIETVWDDRLREGGKVLADETDKAYKAIDEDADWCFYIQGDELIHEASLPLIRAEMETHLLDSKVEGLLFKYRHFYGSYDYVADARKWYRREIRIIRKDKAIHSWKDAQGFRKSNKKLKVKLIDAYVHHYGWVKHPKEQQLKQLNFNKLWHSDDWVDQHVPNIHEFEYGQIDTLKKFEGTHPAVIQERIRKMNWEFDFDPTQRRLSLKEKASRLMETWTNYRLGEYKNYILLK